MKNWLLQTVLAGVAACTPCLSHAQTDVTETYLSNPSFESQFTNWINSGMQSQTNTSFTRKDGNTYVEKWTSQGNRVGDASVSQTVAPLPNGTYQLTAAAQNIQQNNSATQSGAYVFAGDEQTAVHAAADYSVTFTVIEGQVSVGFRAEGATGNWIACDNFRLYAIDTDLAGIHAALEARIAAAMTLVSEKMQADALTELNAAIEAARQELSAATDENTATAAIRLREAMEAASASIEAYKSLQTAIAAATEAYGDGSQAGADELDTAIREAQSTMDGTDASVADLAEAVAALERAVLLFQVTNPTDTAPTVVTDTRYARGATIAFGRSTITGVAVANLKEHGFCWSTDPEPTILDNRSTEYLENNGRIYVMRDLKPSTIYYVRAYAMTQGNAVGYGDPIRIITIPKGAITWSYDNGAGAEANARINAAVGSAVTYWNNATSIKGLNLSVHYGSGTPTADCSYGGWMRVGPNASYQRTGTIMHEMGHAIGVGTHSIWWNAALRADGDRGNWLGERANAVVRFWDNDNTAVMKGDNTHMWPYGINGAFEDAGTEVLYWGNALITQALGEDGLPPTGGFATPSYVFEHADQVKYYIKNESPDGGLYSTYLVDDPSAARLACVTMTAAEAAANDNAAWYVTFDPATCYYAFCNAGTGKYITYTSRNQFATTTANTPTTAEKFQLMRSRTDAVVGTVASRGYWIIRPEATLTPNCMSVNASGRTTTVEYDLTNSASIQRWLFLTAEELAPLDEALRTQQLAELADLIAMLRALAATPHTEDTEGVDAAFEQQLSSIEERMADASLASTAVDDIKDEAIGAALDFLAGATPVSVAQPFDISFLMSDPGITDCDGWSAAPSNITYSCAEFFERTFNFFQEITKLPAGTYQFLGQGFQRPGATDNVYSAYINGNDNVSAYIYAGEQTATFKNIASEAQESRLGGTEKAVGSNPTRYVPNNMQAASLYFAAGLYENSVVTELATDNAKLKVGVRCTLSNTNYWTIFDNFRLYYYGTKTAEEVTTGIRPALADEAAPGDPFATPADIYSLSGVCVRRQATSVEGLPKGIYIVRGQKLLVR